MTTTPTAITRNSDGTVAMACPADSMLAACLGAIGSHGGEAIDETGRRFTVDDAIIINDDNPAAIVITFTLRPVADAAPATE